LAYQSHQLDIKRCEVYQSTKEKLHEFWDQALHQEIVSVKRFSTFYQQTSLVSLDLFGLLCCCFVHLFDQIMQ